MPLGTVVLEISGCLASAEAYVFDTSGMLWVHSLCFSDLCIFCMQYTSSVHICLFLEEMEDKFYEIIKNMIKSYP